MNVLFTDMSNYTIAVTVDDEGEDPCLFINLKEDDPDVWRHILDGSISTLGEEIHEEMLLKRCADIRKRLTADITVDVPDDWADSKTGAEMFAAVEREKVLTLTERRAQPLAQDVVAQNEKVK